MLIAKSKMIWEVQRNGYKKTIFTKDEPAPTEYVMRITYMGRLVHRDDGPAIIACGQRDTYNLYVSDGLIHRENGPAYEYESQTTIAQTYYNYDQKHRIDGPAKYVDYMGQCTEFYYIRNMLITEIDHRGATKPDYISSALNILPIPIADEIWHYYTHY